MQWRVPREAGLECLSLKPSDDCRFELIARHIVLAQERAVPPLILVPCDVDATDDAHDSVCSRRDSDVGVDNTDGLEPVGPDFGESFRADVQSNSDRRAPDVDHPPNDARVSHRNSSSRLGWLPSRAASDSASISFAVALGVSSCETGPGIRWESSVNLPCSPVSTAMRESLAFARAAIAVCLVVK